MPTRIITIYVCSLCQSETEVKEKVTPYQLTGGGGGALNYDVCETCQVAEPFASLLEAGMSDRVAGRKPPKAKSPVVPDEGEVTCEICGHIYSAQGIGQHLSRAHGVRTPYRAALEARGKVGDHVCDEPGCDFRATKPQGLGAHKRSKHGVPGPKSRPAKK